jgi:hypothetical protein
MQSLRNIRRENEGIFYRKLHNEELHNLHPCQIIRMIKPWKMRWAKHVARMGRRGLHIGYWWESQKEGTTRKTKT